MASLSEYIYPVGTTEFRGTVEQVKLTTPSFSVGTLQTSDKKQIPFTGKFSIVLNQPLILYGKWAFHEKFGPQFEADAMEFDMGLDADGVVKYIANNPGLKGFGPARARLMVEAFGDEFEETLLSDPDKIASCCKISPQMVRELSVKWRRDRNLNHIGIQLSRFGLSQSQQTAVIEKFGASSVNLIRNDPYLLVHTVKGLGFKKVDNMALKNGMARDAPCRIKAAVFYQISERLNQGDCFVVFDDLVYLTLELLDIPAFQIEEVLNDMIEKELLGSMRLGGKQVVANKKILRNELQLADIFKRGTETGAQYERFSGILSDLTRLAPTLNAGQRGAVQNALTYRLSVITGGAGTGKTFLVKSIADLAGQVGMKIILAAPTGKAAKRLEESTGMPALTMHRLLNYDGEKFHPEKIEAGLVLLDEFSMVDVPLAWAFFNAVDLSRTSVVMIGDHNQLPPVGPGNILRDILAGDTLPKVVLDEVMRHAGELKENSQALLNGIVRPTVKTSENRCAWALVNNLDSTFDVHNYIMALIEQYLDELGYDLIRDVQFLTPTHNGAIGTRNLNICLQKALQKKLYGVEVPSLDKNRRPPFLLNDKVIQIRNNYDTGIMNGTLGYVVDADATGNLLVNFDGREVEFESDSSAFNDLSHAYALSTHKAQGSEFPCVVTIVHSSHHYMHHRNLFYTAVTRAAKTAIIIGDDKGIRNCARINHADQRKTFLAHLLK